MRKLHVVPIMVLLAFTMALVTCESKEEPLSISVKMNCVKLDFATVKSWHDAGLTKDLNFLFLQFYSGNASNSNKNLEILAYPAKDYNNFIADSVVLPILDDSCSQRLSGKIVYGNLVVYFKALNIIDTTSGKLVEFDFIKLNPTVRDSYVVFDVEVIKSGQPLPTDPLGRYADPCPPYCPVSPFGTMVSDSDPKPDE